jgi:hypothetical protein
MNGAAWLLALATLGVDYGWRLDEKGQLEYIIQISPSQLDSLRESPEGISSAIPPEVARHVKRFRIVVGNEALPRDPLPEFAGEEGLGRVTPIKLGSARVTPAGADFPINEGAAGYQPELESTVTPLENLNAPRNALPGPGQDVAGDPRDNVDDILPLPPIPRASGLLTQSPLATTSIGPTLRREGRSDGGFAANVSPNTHAPDTSDVWGASTRNTSIETPTTNRSLPRRELTPSWNGNTGVDTAKNPLPLFFAVCALCLSIGGNVYLGWIAWGYYLKYRESFDSLRGHSV